MSSESTALYFDALNRGIREHLGGLHSAQLLVYSLDFAPVEALQRNGHWEQAADIIARGLDILADGHADVALICSVTGQRDWDYLQERCRIPLLCARKAVCDAVSRSSTRRIGLLGTRYTMEQPHFRTMLENVAVQVQIPGPPARQRIQSIIYDELCRGRKSADSHAFLTGVLEDWRTEGVEAAVLGCTELPLLLSEDRSPLPLFDVVQIHTQTALEHLLKNN